MKNIRAMSYKELYKEFSIYLNKKYLEYIIKDRNVLAEFKMEFDLGNKAKSGASFLKSFLEKHSSFVDNEAYVFYTLKSIKEANLENVLGRIIAKCAEALKDSNYKHFEANELTNWNDDEIRCVTVQELIGSEYIPSTSKKKIEKSDSSKRIAEVEKYLAFDNFFSIHSTAEMEKIFGRNDELSRNIIKIGLINALDYLEPISLKDKRKLLRESYRNELHERFMKNMEGLRNDVPMKIFIEAIPRYVKKYPDQFDLDKIFLIAAFRANGWLEKANLTDEAKQAFSIMLQVIRDIIKNQNAEVSGLDSDDGLGRNDNTYSYYSLLEACRRINKNGEYISINEELDTREKIIDNPSEIHKIDPEIIRMLKLTMEEYKILTQEEGTLQYLIKNKLIRIGELNKLLQEITISENDFAELVRQEFINKTKILEYIEKEGHIGQTIFETLEEKETLTSEEKLRYFINGVIELDSLDSMTDAKKREISDLLSPKELMNLYKDETKKAEYLRYASIFRNMVLAGKTKKAKEDIGEQIIEAIGMELEEKDLKELYSQHLISLKTVEGWSGSNVITEMMRQALLRPVDVKDICSNGDYECLFDIMKDLAIPRKNKLAIFYTTFCDEDDTLTSEQKALRELAKEECLKYMRFSDKTVNLSKGKEELGDLDWKIQKKEMNMYLTHLIDGRYLDY